MIPEKFTLGGFEFKVEIVDNIDNTGLGRAINCMGKIKLAKMFYGSEMPKDSIERNFYHELVHTILGEIGESELSNKESFVDTFSCLLYQFEKTKQ